MDNKIPVNSLDYSSIHAWGEFKRYLVTENRFVLNKQQQLFVSNVIKAVQNRTTCLKQGEIWYRARRCFEDYSGSHPKVEGNKKIYGRFPAKKEEMDAPPINSATDGRANPRQFPMLYLAKKEETAMTETRPFLGELITLAPFKLDCDLKVVDLVSTQFNGKNDDICQMEQRGEITSVEVENYIWEMIGHDFSIPTDPSDSDGKYVPTQYLAGVFKNAGFDGIMYSSALKKGGINLVLFDPCAANSQVGKIFCTSAIEYNFVGSGPQKEYRS